jgi:hypothetical protein
VPVGRARLGDLARDRPIPAWAQVVGAVLLLAFLALSVDAYFGPGLRSRVLPFIGRTQAPSQAIPTRVFYEPGSAVRVGQESVGSEGQDRVIQEGDVVLLGATGQLVRLGPGGRAAEITGSDGASTTVTNLGAWDHNADRLAGVAAQYRAGRWNLDEIPLQSLGADLHPAGAPSEALTDGFWLGPDPDAGRVRRVGDRDQPALRIRASKKTPAMMLESRQPLSSLDGTFVSVTAVVRGQPGKTIALTLEDVLDATGNVEAVAERRPATEEWTRMTVRRRVAFPSEKDRIAVGLVDADAGDWIEVRDLDVVLGVLP